MKKTLHTAAFTLIAVIGMGCLDGLLAQSARDQDEVWRAFVAWFKTVPMDSNPARAYFMKLQKEGVPGPEIKRRVDIIQKMFLTRPEGTELFFDRTFSRTLTGDPARDGFNSSPSAFLVSSTERVNPGTALDAAMGQGRNAVYLAQKGWKVTGFDISTEAVAAARANASKAGVTIDAVKDSYETFDFGKAKWDLIVLTFAWAPVTDPAFVAKLKASLNSGGMIVFEHFLEVQGHFQPAAVRAIAPGRLRAIFSDFMIDSYDEGEGVGDWGGPGSRLVRMVARKP